MIRAYEASKTGELREAKVILSTMMLCSVLLLPKTKETVAKLDKHVFSLRRGWVFLTNSLAKNMLSKIKEYKGMAAMATTTTVAQEPTAESGDGPTAKKVVKKRKRDS